MGSARAKLLIRLFQHQNERVCSSNALYRGVSTVQMSDEDDVQIIIYDMILRVCLFESTEKL